MHCKHGLDESRDTGRGLQMTEIGLHRPDQQGLAISPVGEDLTQRLELDRIAERCPGAMGFHVVDVGGLQPRGRQRLAQQRLLGRSGGEG